MNIRTWLLVTYLLVMILPLGALYALYVSIHHYYEDQSIAEYFDKWQHVMDMKDALAKPTLYTERNISDDVKELSNEQTMVTLYLPTGKVLYSSNPTSMSFEGQKPLYENLYEFQQNYSHFIYKEPVYAQGQIVGIYKVTVARTEWTEQVGHEMKLVVSGLVLFILTLYGVVILFLRKRLHEPLQKLMRHMHAFAKGEAVTAQPTTNDEIGKLAASFYAMQQEIEQNRTQLEQEQRQKEMMIASLSHDLKTPLTSIQAYAESVRNGKLTDTERDNHLAVVQTKVDYMKQLLDDLMMYTLLQSPTYTLELVEVDGDEFFDMLLGDYEQVSEEKGFIATTECAINGTYDVNPKQLMRVVDNLVSNAWTYTEAGGTIHLAAFNSPHKPSWCIASCEEDGAYIVIQNSGATFTSEQCKQLFEPLYQHDASRSQIGQRGAGLGLSIAKQIIEKHRGTIEAVSHNNEVAICIWLPKIKKV